MNTIDRFAYVMKELGLALICLAWVIYGGVHWLFTGRNIIWDKSYAIVRFLDKQ